MKLKEAIAVFPLQVRELENLVNKLGCPLCRGLPRVMLLVVSALDSLKQAGKASFSEILPPESIDVY